MRLPFRNPDRDDDPFRDARRRALLRGAGKFVVVVVAAIAGGTLLGVGLSELNGDDSSSAPAVAGTTQTETETIATVTETTATETQPTATITTADAPALRRAPEQSSGGRLRVDVLSSIVHPITGDANRSARTGVHVRVTNGSDRVVSPEEPVLLVGDTEIQLRRNAAAAPLLGALGQGAIADGTLTFETAGAVTQELTTGRVRIRVAGKMLTLTPQIGSATSG